MRPAGPISGSSFHATSVNHRDPGRPLTPTIFPPVPILIPPRREQLPVSASKYVSTGYFGTPDSSRSDILRWRGIPRSTLPAIAVATSSNASAFGDPNTAAVLVTSKSFPSKLLKARKSWRNDRKSAHIDDVDLETRDRLLVGYDIPVPEKLGYDNQKIYLVTNKKTESDLHVNIPLPAVYKETNMDVPILRQQSVLSSGDGSSEIRSRISGALDGPLETVSAKIGNIQSRLHPKISTDFLRVHSRTSRTSQESRDTENSQSHGTRKRDRFGFSGMKNSLSLRRTRSATNSEKRRAETEAFLQAGRKKDKSPKGGRSNKSKSKSDLALSDSEDSSGSTTKLEAPSTKEDRIKVGHFLFGERPPIISKSDPRRISVPANVKEILPVKKTEDEIKMGIARSSTAPVNETTGSDRVTTKPSGLKFRPIHLSGHSGRRLSVAPALSPVSEAPRRLRRRMSSMIPPGSTEPEPEERYYRKHSLLKPHAAKSHPNLKRELPSTDAYGMSPHSTAKLSPKTPSPPHKLKLRVQVTSPPHDSLPNISPVVSRHPERIQNHLFKSNFWAEADSSLTTTHNDSYHDHLRDPFWAAPDAEIPLPPWKKTGDPLEKWLDTLPDIPGLSLNPPTTTGTEGGSSNEPVVGMSGALRTQLDLLRHEADSAIRETERAAEFDGHRPAASHLQALLPPTYTEHLTSERYPPTVGVSPVELNEKLEKVSTESFREVSKEEMVRRLREVEREWAEQTEKVGGVLSRMMVVVDEMVVRDWERRQRGVRAGEMGWDS